MAVFVGVHDRVFVGHLDLTDHTREVDFGTLTRAMQDSTTFADGGFTCVKPGLISGEAAVKGFQDFAADVLDDEINVAQLGSQYPVTVVPNATGTVAVSDPCWMSRGLIGAINPLTGAKGEMGGFELGIPYDAAIVQAVVAAPKATVSATTTGADVALVGPTASQKIYAALHVTQFAGFTNEIFTLESDDNSGFTSATTRITFTTVTGTTSEFLSLAGDLSTETHWRIVATKTGTGTCTYAAFVGVI